MTLTFGGLVVAVVVAVLTAAGSAAGAVWFLSGRIDASRREVRADIDRLDAKNEAAHAGIVARVDGLARDVSGIGRDVSFLAGRQAERDRRDGRDSPAPRETQG